jgi:hypothetical protein
MFWKGGEMWRETNDLWAPTDTPDAGLRFFTKTQAGWFLWDGARHTHQRSGTRTTVADANKTVAASDELIAYTSLTAGRAVTLPAPAAGNAGRVVEVLDESGAAATHNLTVSAASGNINGSSTNVISANYGFRRYRSNGTAWFVV